ncbi:S8 family serine peptidase [Actinokineospora sp. 24-640]
MTPVGAVRARWAAGVGLAAALSATVLLAPPAVAEGTVLSVPQAIEGSYIVVLKDGAQLAQSYGAAVTHTYSHALNGFAAKLTEKQARTLAADPAVAYVQQDGVVSLAATQPNPPSWGLDRIDQRDLPLNNSYTYPNAGAGVRAYVIDTGIRTTHADFGGRATWGTNTVGDGNNSDCNGHGTHVAGTIGGAAHGVAKAVSLTAVKVLSCAGSGSWAGVIAGVDWVTADHTSGPAVANMSLGGNGSNAALEDAVRRSIADGVVYALASGNSNSDACNFTPARTAEAITVNATANTDARASFSNWGTCTDIFAPGQNITSAWHTSDSAVNTISGTSMAAPHVAGAAALVLAAAPSSTPAQVAAQLYSSATANKVTSPGTGSPNRLLHVAGGSQPPANDHLTRGQGLGVGASLKSANGAYTLVMQGDGNLVLYNTAGAALWHTNTWGNPGATATFQSDGNFVVYAADGRALWHTGTNNTAASLFIVQDDSNIVLYGPTGQVFWHRLG